MSSGIAAALSTSANANSTAVTMSMAARAKRIACEGLVGSYDPKTASVELMREYADCIDLLYPNPMTPVELGWLKLLLIACFIGGGIGSWWFGKDSWDGIVGYIMGFFLGFVGTGVGLFILGLLLAALGFIVGL
jgi:hypothetical protein